MAVNIGYFFRESVVNFRRNWVMSLGAVIIANPQVIITDRGHGDGGNSPFEFAMAEPWLETVAARRNGRVYQIDSDLVTLPGPRIIDGLEEMARLLQPDIFGQG